MRTDTASYFEITNGAIRPISAFAANQLDADDARAEGVAAIVGDALRKVTNNGFVIYGTQDDALQSHNRLFTLGARTADNDNLAAGIKKDFAGAAARFHLGRDFSMAAMAARTPAPSFGLSLRAA